MVQVRKISYADLIVAYGKLEDRLSRLELDFKEFQEAKEKEELDDKKSTDGIANVLNFSGRKKADK